MDPAWQRPPCHMHVGMLERHRQQSRRAGLAGHCQERTYTPPSQPGRRSVVLRNPGAILVHYAKQRRQSCVCSRSVMSRFRLFLRGPSWLPGRRTAAICQTGTAVRHWCIGGSPSSRSCNAPGGQAGGRTASEMCSEVAPPVTFTVTR